MQRIRSLHTLKVVDSTSSVSISGDAVGMRESFKDTATSLEPQQQQEQHPRGHEGLQKKTRFLLLWLRRHVTSTKVQVCAATLAVMLLIALITRRMWLSASSTQGPQLQYTVYIDGGSSGTRVHVFQYWLAQVTPRTWDDIQLVLPEKTFAVEPGLSSYAGRPQQAAAALEPLLDFAHKHVPEELWHDTPVYLLATAGLRLLSHEDASDILTACSQYLTANSDFKHRPDWARIISGDAEGLYAWTAVNYVSGALQDAPSLHHFHARKELLPHQRYQGVLELGGASFQVTFLPAAPAPVTTGDSQRRAPLSVPGVTQPLFTHSYLGLGMDSAMHAAADIILNQHHQQLQAHRNIAAADQAAASGSVQGDARHAWDPCLPQGFELQDGRQGNGSFDACMAVVQQVLPPRVCSRSHKAAAQADGHASHHLHLAGQELHDPASRGATAHQHSGADTVSRQSSKQGSQGSSIASNSVESEACIFAGVHVPTLDGTQFIALENFFWTARALGLGPVATLAQFRAAGEQHCQRTWSELHHLFAGHVPGPFIARYCFGAAYVYLLLRERLGMSEHAPLLFTNTIKRPRLVQLQQHAQHGKHPQPGMPAGSRHLDGLGNSTGEVEVGLSWVVGALVVQTMAPGIDQIDSQQDFLGHRGDGWPDSSDMEIASEYAWLLVLVPVLLMLMLVVWACGGLGGASGAWQRMHTTPGGAAVGLTGSMPLLMIGDTRTSSSAAAPVR